MRKIDVFITKQTVSDGFYVMMRGHYPNPKFASIVSNRLTTYEEAYRMGKTIDNVVSLLGNEVRLGNDRWAAQDGEIYCDHMAFEPLETIE